MKIYSFKCPQCGGDLEIKEDLEVFYCTYCGAKLTTDAISKSELRIKEMEHEEKMREQDQKETKRDYMMIVGCFIFALVVILIMAFGIPKN